MILLTGATGYVGGELLPVLLASGRRVRCLARRPEALTDQVALGAEVVAGDVLDPAALDAALQGVEHAYYLVHAMASEGAFEERDRTAARLFGESARKASVRRIIYLGALGSSRSELSPHLRSRHEVGEILRASGVPVIEFRASIVIGSGSLSFEMVRALVERLPVMIAPQWVAVPAQPIATHLRLAARMKLPGQAWLEFRVDGNDSASVIRQTATFDPRGLLGRAYWYLSYPLHRFCLQACSARSDGLRRAKLKWS